MRSISSMSDPLLPGSLAGVIYFFIALGTGASLGASIIGAAIVAAVTTIIGFILQAAFTRRSPTHRR
jgi:hypothetical protein